MTLDALRLQMVRALQRACALVDWLAYRPWLVRLTERMPRWWHCQLAQLSMTLDDRWQTGFWASDGAPPAPAGVCAACHRRAAWLVVGGTDNEDPAIQEDWLALHPLEICGWCHPEFPNPPRTQDDVMRAFAEARKRSVSWRWSGE
jgi:hypothetical protein